MWVGYVYSTCFGYALVALVGMVFTRSRYQEGHYIEKKLPDSTDIGHYELAMMTNKVDFIVRETELTTKCLEVMFGYYGTTMGGCWRPTLESSKENERLGDDLGDQNAG